MTPSGTRTLLISSPLGRRHRSITSSDRIGKRGDLLDARRHRGHPRLIEREPFDERAGLAGALVRRRKSSRFASMIALE